MIDLSRSGGPSSIPADPGGTSVHLSKPSQIICRYCFVRVEGTNGLLQHLEEVKNHGFVKVCHVCCKGFKSLKGYKLHWKLQHSEGVDCPACNICGRKCPTLSNLRLHKRSHSNQRPYVCVRCNSSFKSKYHLQRHVANKRCKDHSSMNK